MNIKRPCHRIATLRNAFAAAGFGVASTFPAFPCVFWLGVFWLGGIGLGWRPCVADAFFAEEESAQEGVAPELSPEEIRRQLLRLEDSASVAIRVFPMIEARDEAVDSMLKELLSSDSSAHLLQGILSALVHDENGRFLSDVCALYSLDPRPELRTKIVSVVGGRSSERALKALTDLACDELAPAAGRRGAVELLGALAIPDQRAVGSLIGLLAANERIFINSPNLVAEALSKMTRESRGVDVSLWLEWWEPLQDLTPLDFWGEILGRLETRLKDAEGRAYDSWKAYTEDLRGRKDQIEQYFQRLLAGLSEWNPAIRRFASSKIKEPRVQALVRTPESVKVLLEVMRTEEPAIVLDLAEAIGSWVSVSQDNAAPDEIKGVLEATARHLATRYRDKAGSIEGKSMLVRSLGALGQRVVVPMLLTGLSLGSDASVRADLVLALGEIGDPSAVEKLTEVLGEAPSSKDEDPSWEVRRNAAIALGALGSPESVEALGRALASDRNLRVRYRAADALASLGSRHGEVLTKRVAQAVKGGLKDEDKQVRKSCVNILEQLRDPGVIEDLVSVLTDQDVGVREAGVQAVSALAGSSEVHRARVLPEVVKRFQDSDPKVVVAAVESVVGLLADDVPRLLTEIDLLARDGDDRTALALTTSYLAGVSEDLSSPNIRKVRERVLLLLASSEKVEELQRALTMFSELRQVARLEPVLTYRVLEARIHIGLDNPKKALEVLSQVNRSIEGGLKPSDEERWEVGFESMRAEFALGQSGEPTLIRLYDLEGRLRGQRESGNVEALATKERGRRIELFVRKVREAISARLIDLIRTVESPSGTVPVELRSAGERAIDDLLILLEGEGDEPRNRRVGFVCLQSLLRVDDSFSIEYDPVATRKERSIAVAEIRQWREARKRN